MRPPSGSGERTVEPPGPRGAANVGFMWRGGTDRGLSRGSLPDLPRELPGTATRNHPGGSGLDFFLFVWLVGLGCCCFPTSRQYLGVNQIIKKGLWWFGTPAGAVGAPRADKEAHLHRRAAGGLTAAAEGRLFIATAPGARCCHAVAVAGTDASRSPASCSQARLLRGPLGDSRAGRGEGGEGGPEGRSPRA